MSDSTQRKDTRALQPDQAARIRARLDVLHAALGSDERVGLAIGMSQQNVHAIRAGSATPGLLAVVGLAEHDGVPVDFFLSDIPDSLRAVVYEHPRRWSKMSIAFLVAHRATLATRRYDQATWCSLLDQCEAFRREKLRMLPF